MQVFNIITHFVLRSGTSVATYRHVFRLLSIFIVLISGFSYASSDAAFEAQIFREKQCKERLLPFLPKSSQSSISPEGQVIESPLEKNCRYAASNRFKKYPNGTITPETYPFVGVFFRRCLENPILKEADCTALSKDIGWLSSVRCDKRFQNCEGGGPYIEDYLVRHPEIDPVIQNYMLKLRQYNKDPNKFPTKDEIQKLNQIDLWDVIKSAMNVSGPDDRIPPKLVSEMIHVVALFSYFFDFDADAIGARLATDIPPRRYAFLYPYLSGFTSGSPSDLLFAHPTKLFGIFLPDPERNRHALMGVVQGCELREKGYSTEVATEAAYQVGLIYKWFTYRFVSGDFKRDQRSPSNKTVDDAIWDPKKKDEAMAKASEPARKALAAALNGAEMHRLGGAFAANLCSP